MSAAGVAQLQEWNEAVQQRVEELALIQVFEKYATRTICCICQRTLTGAERRYNIEERPTGFNFKIQRWAYCDVHYAQVPTARRAEVRGWQ